MKRHHPGRAAVWTLAVLIIFSMLVSACQLPASETPTPVSEEALLTQGAETVAADLTSQAVLAIPATQTQVAAGPTATGGLPSATSQPPQPPTSTQPPQATATQAPPQASATTAPPTATDTPLTPTATATLAVATITAEIDTNCRQGPWGSTEVISGLRAGKTAAVFGKDATETWWYIQRPGGKVNEYCWVWGDTTQVDVDPDLLPVIPPIPVQLSPASSQWYYSVAGVNIHPCNVPMAFIGVHNAGFKSFQSARVTSYDATTGLMLDDSSSNSPFTSSDRDCGGGFNVLSQNVSGYVRSPLTTGLTGHMIGVGVTLCEQPNLGGKCFYEMFAFTAP